MHFNFFRRSVVVDLTEILTTEFTNIIKKAHDSIVHFDRRIAATLNFIKDEEHKCATSRGW